MKIINELEARRNLCFEFFLLICKTGHFPKKVDIGECNWTFMVKKVDIDDRTGFR